MVQQKFEKVLIGSDFDEVDLSINTNSYTKAYEYVVGAQQLMTFGKGQIVNGVDDRGDLQIVLKNSGGTTLSGWVRLAITDAQEVNKVVIFEDRTENLNTKKLAEYVTKAREDSKLIIEVKGDTADTISTSQSTIIVPTTVYIGSI